MAASSSAEMIPWAASIAACAFEPRISWGASTLSNSMEALISSMIWAGDMEKRPPHILLAGPPAEFSSMDRGSRFRSRHHTFDERAESAKMFSSTSARSGLIGLAAALVGFGAVYVTLGPDDNGRTSAPSTTPAAETAAKLPETLPKGPGANPLSKGDMAAFVFKSEPEPLPEFSFVDATGVERSLKDW